MEITLVIVMKVILSIFCICIVYVRIFYFYAGFISELLLLKIILIIIIIIIVIEIKGGCLFWLLDVRKINLINLVFESAIVKLNLQIRKLINLNKTTSYLLIFICFLVFISYFFS